MPGAQDKGTEGWREGGGGVVVVWCGGGGTAKEARKK